MIRTWTRTTARPSLAAVSAPTSSPTSARHLSAPRTGAVMAMGSMWCVQLGLAASVGLFDRIGPTGTACVRLLWAGLILLAIGRPRPSAFTRSGLAACVALGTVTAGLTILFTEALARIPLGTAAALEFLGPLGVALLRGRGRARGWALLAALGVVLLTNPLLLPVVPFSLELLALRRLTAPAFGTLMCLEPAIALGVGVVLLHQTPSPAAAAGVAAVVLAGVGAERSGARAAPAGSEGIGRA